MEKILSLLRQIVSPDQELMEKARQRLDSLTKPRGSLGRLEELAWQVVGITRKENPSLKSKVIITMAADHGVVEEGVSAYPREVTAQMVYNFLGGGAGINVLARHAGARVTVVDMGVAADLGRHPHLINKKIGCGTRNITRGPAMTREESIRAVEAGLEIVKEELTGGMDIVGTGDMGIGNTTSSSAIVATFTGEKVGKVTGRGTGIDDQTLGWKIEVVEKSLAINKPDPRNPLEVLEKVGGFEIGGLVGVILEGAANRIPVVIDGFISGAAALIACTLEPKVKDYLIASHCSAEPGHRVILDFLGLKPILNLNLRLGEGTGAVLGMFLVEAAVKILTEMATFQEAGVSEKIK